MNVYTDSHVCVNRGVKHPDIPGLNIGGWTGHVLSIQRKDENVYYCTIWLDDVTIYEMSKKYIDYCRQNNLNYKEIVLSIDKVHVM